MGKFKDLTGMDFGRLRVIELSGKNQHGQYMWLCECSCPDHNRITVCSGSLISNNTQSCGCYKKDCARNLKIITNGCYADNVCDLDWYQ